MYKKNVRSFMAGFVILFFLYHLPEFFSAFWIMAACKIGFLIAAFIIARAQGYKGLAGLLLSLKPHWGINLVTGIFVGILGFSISYLLSVQMHYEKIVTVSSMTTIIKELPMILLMTAIPSMAEDILTRGYLYVHLTRFMRPVTWIVISSVIYVLNHIGRLNDGPAVLTYLFLLGLVLAYAVIFVQSLWLAFGIHWGANIAFESSRTLIHSATLTTGDNSTWILAGVWGMLFIILAAIKLIKNRYVVDY